MYSIKFPDMLSSVGTNLVEGSTATLSNTRLLLGSWKTSLFGDPDFGTNLKRFIYNQNNIILKDIIIDDIFTSLQVYIPQITVKRDEIRLRLEKDKIFCTINCINKLDSSPNLFDIELTEEN